MCSWTRFPNRFVHTSSLHEVVEQVIEVSSSPQVCSSSEMDAWDGFLLGLCTQVQSRNLGEGAAGTCIRCMCKDLRQVQVQWSANNTPR